MKNTRKLLVSSMIMILSCCLLFAGTTFAWFSDSVTSDNNIITAGNLDVELEYSTTGKDGDWRTVQDASIFTKDTIWEPGHTEAVVLRVKNAGSLAFKYSLKLKVTEEVESVNVDGKTFKLSDYLTVGAKVTEEFEGKAIESRNGAKEIAKDNEIGFASITPVASLLKGKESYVQLVIYMPEEVGNEANHAKDAPKPTITFGIELVATQLNYEQDSFDKNYDKGAAWLGEIDTDWYKAEQSEFTLVSGAELAGLAQLVNGGNTFAGKTVKLGANINLSNTAWTPIGLTGDQTGFAGTFDGQGYIISNLLIDLTAEPKYQSAGLFGSANSAVIKNFTVKDANVKNLIASENGNTSCGAAVVLGSSQYGSTVENVKVIDAEVSGNRYVSAIAGYFKGSINGCSVNKAKLLATPDNFTGEYDNGDKVGAIIGFSNGAVTLTNNAVSDVEIKGYRDLGGIAGAANCGNVSGNTVSNVKLIADQVSINYGEKAVNTQAVVGRVLGGQIGENKTEAVVIEATYLKDGLELYSDGTEVMLYKVPADFTGNTVIVPKGVTCLRNKALQNDTRIKEVILPLSVTDFGGTPNADGKGASGSFFYKSAVEKITLPEGLKEIPVAAFNQAYNLKEVNIPSTVTTLGINAFAGSGLESLTIPSTITSIGYGAFRDMASLETIVFEGDVVLPGYALRACANLKTVVFQGNVSFADSTASGMVITNKSNGDGSAITVYVPNDESKEALLAKDTASKDYGGYKIVVGSKAVSTASDLIAELNNGSAVRLSNSISTPATVKAPYGNYAGLIQKGGLLDGMGETLSVTGGGDTYAIMTYGGTIKNLVIDYGFRGIVLYSPTEDVIIDNVYVAGKVGYTINTAEYPTVSGIDLIVSNSTFGGWMSFAGIESASFTNCKFIYGSYYNTWPYDSVFKPMVNTTLTNCDFAQEYYLDLSDLGAGCTIKLANCTVNGVKITADNFAQLFGEVELPSGRTISDCIIFA